MGISALGLIGALIANLAFLQARLGFFIGAMFFVVSLVCQAAFVNRALLSVEDAGLEADALSAFKRSVITLAQTSVGVTMALVGFTAPLLLVDAYRGLEAGSMVILGLIGAAVFLAVYGAALIFVNNALIKKGVYTLDEKQMKRLHRLRRLKKRCAGRLLVILVLTFAFQAFGAEMIWNMQQLAFGTTFYDYESFVEYMEQDVPFEGQSYSAGWFTTAEDSPVAPERAPGQEETWYDEFGKEISEEEVLTRTLEDKNGRVVCTYVDRNQAVTSLRYSPQEDTVLPITVFTHEEYQRADRLSRLVTAAYCLLYPLEIAAAGIWYFRRRRQEG